MRACVRLAIEAARASQNLGLAPRKVVLREPGDLLVEMRAALVVEPDRGQLLCRGLQASGRRLVEGRTTGGLVVENVDANGSVPLPL